MHEHEILPAEAQSELVGIAFEPHGPQNLRIGWCAR